MDTESQYRPTEQAESKYRLENISIDVVGSQNDGKCPGNETALAAITLTDPNLPREEAIKIREQMRDKHNLGVIGSMIFFDVTGDDPRIIFTESTEDADGNIFEPGMLYAPNMDDLRLLIKDITESGLEIDPNERMFIPRNSGEVTKLRLTQVRTLGNVPYTPRNRKLVDEEGQSRGQMPSTEIAKYIRMILKSELDEAGGTKPFYESLAKNLPKIFSQKQDNPSHLQLLQIRPNNPSGVCGVDARVGKDYDKTKSQMVRSGTSNEPNYYHAIKNPIDALYPQSQETYIIQVPIKSDDGSTEHEYYFVPRSEFETKEQVVVANDNL